MDPRQASQQLETLAQKKERKAVEEMARAGGYRTVEDHAAQTKKPYGPTELLDDAIQSSD
jgi:glycerate kinase